MSRVYLYNADTAGYAVDAPSGSGIHFDYLTAAGIRNVSAACVARGDPNTVYAMENATNRFAVSHDGGNTWTIKPIAQLNHIPTPPTVYGMVSVQPGEIHLYQNTTKGVGMLGKQGIWRSTNDGDSWTQIKVTKTPLAPQTDPFGGYLSAGTNRLWYAMCGGDKTTVTTQVNGISRGAPAGFRCAPTTGAAVGNASPSNSTVHVTRFDPGCQDFYIGWGPKAICDQLNAPCQSTNPDTPPWEWRAGPINGLGDYPAAIYSADQAMTSVEIAGMATIGTSPTNNIFYSYTYTALVPSTVTHSLIEIHTCNFDGTVDHHEGGAGFISYTVPSGQVAPTNVIVRAIDDTFCMVASARGGGLHRVTASSIANVKPAGIDKPWDVAIFDPNRMVVVGTSASGGNNVLTYRTTQGGGSSNVWSAGPIIPAAQGFAARDIPDRYQVIDVARNIAAPTESVMYGYADGATKQYLHFTNDRGVTWTAFRNEAALAAAGAWADLGIGGILAAPAAIGGPQVMILG